MFVLVIFMESPNAHQANWLHWLECFCRFTWWRFHQHLGWNLTSVHRYISEIIQMEHIFFSNSSHNKLVFKLWLNISFRDWYSFLHGSQMKTDTDPPQLTFFLLIHNMGPVGGSGTNLFQVAIRDSISGIVPLRSEGRVVERGYQMFSIDSLSGKDWKKSWV